MARQQNLDVQQFEQALMDFKDKFGRTYELASSRFNKAIDEIDQTIRHLEKVKEYLTKSGNQYRLANGKAQDLSIRKLTKGNPTMQDKFAQAGIKAEWGFLHCLCFFCRSGPETIDRGYSGR